MAHKKMYSQTSNSAAKQTGNVTCVSMRVTEVLSDKPTDSISRSSSFKAVRHVRCGTLYKCVTVLITKIAIPPYSQPAGLPGVLIKIRYASPNTKPGIAIGNNIKTAQTVLDAACNARQVLQLTEAFGGPRFMTDREREFIENWEVESYRAKQVS